MFGKFLKRGRAAALFDGSRNALRQEQPPRDDISVPGVDDYIDVLIEQIAVDDFDSHSLSHFKRLAVYPT